MDPFVWACSPGWVDCWDAIFFWYSLGEEDECKRSDVMPAARRGPVLGCCGQYDSYNFQQWMSRLSQ
jgi:hypothetical protein